MKTIRISTSFFKRIAHLELKYLTILVLVLASCSSNNDTEDTPAPDTSNDPPSITVTIVSNATLLSQTGIDYFIEVPRDLDLSLRLSVSIPGGFASGTRNGEPIGNSTSTDLNTGKKSGIIDVTYIYLSGGLDPEEFIITDQNGKVVKVNIHIKLPLGFNPNDALAGSWATTAYKANESHTSINQIFGTQAGSLLVVNDNDIYRSTNGGSTWSQTAISQSAWLGTMAQHNDGSLYVTAIEPGNIFKSLDDGQSWTLLSTNLPALSGIRDIKITANGVFYISAWLNIQNSTVNGIYKSENGTDWAYVKDLEGIEGLFLDGNTNVYAYTKYPGRLIKSTDSGSTWDTVNTPSSEFVTSFAIANNNWYLGTGNNFYRSTDQGATWQVYNTSLPYNKYITSISVSSTNEIYINPTNYGIFKLDQNDTWRSIGTDLGTIYIQSMTFVNNQFFAAGFYTAKVYKLQ
ncbi:WD40/YVTN/BNR-like repeat-containing protein [Geojedonia litorea]|uniref:WD40/YVTN/BNR-like repeat-containing protein n=1 Tax=Geojedonia litorea TaxID=1268269 RepID=A0ABV9N4H7_9FLAO